MEAPHGSARIFGLDVMRAVAIAWVMAVHGVDLLADHWPLDARGTGFDGVDLFFVLSGYLVGGLLLRAFDRGEYGRLRTLVDFWQRRWLRTLPNYQLFLLVNIVLVGVGLAPGLINGNVFAYAVFLQNLWKPLGLFFWESWSLAVEEWFYLLFPLLMLGVARSLQVPMRRAYVPAALLLVVSSVAFRLARPVPATLFEADLHFRELVLARLDAIAIGALAVWCHQRWPSVWSRWRWPLFVSGIAGLIAIARSLDGGALTFVVHWSYSASALAMALLLPVLSTWSRRPAWGGPVVFLSLVSYALYLTHLPLRSLLLPLADGASATAAVVVYALWWTASIALAWAVHRWWERPFMRLRERIGRRLAVSVPSA